MVELIFFTIICIVGYFAYQMFINHNDNINDNNIGCTFALIGAIVLIVIFLFGMAFWTEK